MYAADQKGQDRFNNNGGPLYYIGNRNLSWPDMSGKLSIDRRPLNDDFDVILSNTSSRKFKRHIEPFSGSASLSLAAMELGLAQEYIINDSDKALINTLVLIRDKPNDVKQKYEYLVKEYSKAADKKQFFQDLINTYNAQTSIDEKSLILPFIINHSRGGTLYHDDRENLVYRDGYLKGGSVPGYLDEAPLSLESFKQEVDRISTLLKANKVTFMAGDFLLALSDMQAGDFVTLNPPYPETIRARSGNVAMYTELYPRTTLHNNIIATVEKMEEKGVTYYMTYGCHNPEMQAFVIPDPSGKPRHFLREVGGKNCAYGSGLDQVYMTSTFSIPTHVRSRIIPASDVLQGQELTGAEALKKFVQVAEGIAVTNAPAPASSAAPKVT